MRYFVLAGLLLSALAVAAVLYLNQSAEEDQGDFFRHADLARFDDPYWHQGEAEVNLYQATIQRYGQPRPTGDVAHVLVTERHDPELLVKADDWRREGLLEVLKFNFVVQYQTGVYPYRQMMSVFFDRQRGRVAKLTFSSQEWCGLAFKELVNFRGRSDFDFNTYWDGQGNGSFEVDFPPDAVPYDALPVQLRVLEFEPGLTATFPLVESQFSSKASAPAVEMARLRVQGREPVQVPLGAFESVRLELESAAGRDVFWFETEFPHRMLKWETRDGNRFELRGSRKTAYWAHNRPEDESYLAW